jgi:hypothetical protein
MEPQSAVPKGLVQVGYSINRLIYCWSSPITSRKGEPAGEVFKDVVERSVAWLKKKAPVPFPTTETILAKDWEEEDALQSIKSVAFPEKSKWAIRYKHSDTTVLHRAWTTEVTVEIVDDTCLYHLRLICSGAHVMVWEAEPTVPAIVKTLASFYNLGTPGLKLTPQNLATRDEVLSFVAYLEDPGRSAPVVLLTENDPNRPYYNPAKPHGIDAVELQKALAGLAEVYTLPTAQRFAFIEAVDREWSAFNGAVRVYNPGLTWDDDLHRHPLVLAEVIRYYRYAEKDGAEGFSAFLKDNLFRQNQRSQYRATFADIRSVVQARSAYNRTLVSSDTEYIRLMEEENAELRESLHAKEQELSNWFLEYDNLDRELKTARELLQKERDKNLTLKQGLGRSEKVDPLSELPATYPEVSDWVSRHFSGYLELHGRAKRALKSAVYQDLGLVCRCLGALAGPYSEMRRTGAEDARKRWEAFLQTEHVTISKSISESRLGEDRESYEVDFKGRRRLLESHLKTGTSREPREAMRLYFFYEEAEQVVVVGWLPSHLDTRAT